MEHEKQLLAAYFVATVNYAMQKGVPAIAFFDVNKNTTLSLDFECSAPWPITDLHSKREEVNVPRNTTHMYYLWPDENWGDQLIHGLKLHNYQLPKEILLLLKLNVFPLEVNEIRWFECIEINEDS